MAYSRILDFFYRSTAFRENHMKAESVAKEDRMPPASKRFEWQASPVSGQLRFRLEPPSRPAWGGYSAVPLPPDQ